MAKKPTGLMMVYILKSSSHGELMLIINLLTFHISRYVCCVVSVGTISRQSVGHIVDGKNPAPVQHEQYPSKNIHQPALKSFQLLLHCVDPCIVNHFIFHRIPHYTQTWFQTWHATTPILKKRYSHTDAKFFIDLIILMHSRQPWERKIVWPMCSLL